jgi:hypothetical protein
MPFQIKDDIEAAVKLELQLRSELEFISLNCPAQAGLGGGDEAY